MQIRPRYLIKNVAVSNGMVDKKGITKWMLLSLLSLGLMVMVGLLHAEPVNPYAKNYKEQNTNHLRSQLLDPDTKIFVSNHSDEDNISMLENGYDMIGTSGFTATEAASDLALQHARSIKADTVLVYRKYESAKTASSKLQLIKEAAKTGEAIDPNDLKGEPTQYHYYASYWAKLPMPLLGVHIIKLIQAADEEQHDAVKAEPGLKVIAVIKESPAAKASILKGDTLLKVGEVALVSPDDLFAAVKRYAGQSVPVQLQRNGEVIDVPVALNSRK